MKSLSLKLNSDVSIDLRISLTLLSVAFAVMPVRAGDAAFSDQTAAANVVGSFSQVPHSFLGGGVVGDFDGDGWQDIFYPAGGNGADKLFMNDGDGTFTDAATTWGIDLEHRSTAAAVADFNADGRLDIFVTSLGPNAGMAAGHHKLYRNNGGSFTDVAVAAGVNTSSTSGPDGWGAAWGDYDLDGDLDLAIAGWLETGDGNRLFRNNGDSTFTDVTASAGVSSLAGTNGFAPRFTDMDGDRYPELIWIGDFTSGHYYKNDGDGTFTDLTGTSNTNQDGTEMGMTVADWDEDGDFDFYVTTISTNNLYLNQGNNTYVNAAGSAGVVNTGWGWGTAAVDFDHDTLIDLVATSQGGRNYAFRNNTTQGGGLSFEEIGTTIGVGDSIDGRGLSNFDYDNDGDQDFIVFTNDGTAKLFRNDLSGADIHWLRVFLDTSDSPSLAPGGIGAVVKVTIGGRTLMGRVDGGSNYLSQSEMSAHFGLGSATLVDELRVEWPNGEVTVLDNVAADQTMTVQSVPGLFSDGFETGDLTGWSSTEP